MKRVYVHIDRLVLRGLDGLDRGGFADGLRAEVEKQLGRPESAAALARQGNLGRVRLPGLVVNETDKPVEAGRQLGASLAGRLTS